jgi:hypothetical protein
MFLGFPDPDPLVRGTIRIRLQLQLLPFSHKGAERPELMLANKILTQKFSQKFRLKIMCLRVSYKKKKYEKKPKNFCFLKVTEERSWILIRIL